MQQSFGVHAAASAANLGNAASALRDVISAVCSSVQPRSAARLEK